MTDSITELDVHLHTADPSPPGASNEATYPGYAPAACSRDASAWVRSGNTASNAALIHFPPCGLSSGTYTITHVSFTPRGSALRLAAGKLEQSLAISQGIQPAFAAGALQIDDARGLFIGDVAAPAPKRPPPLPTAKTPPPITMSAAAVDEGAVQGLMFSRGMSRAQAVELIRKHGPKS